MWYPWLQLLSESPSSCPTSCGAQPQGHPCRRRIKPRHTRATGKVRRRRSVGRHHLWGHSLHAKHLPEPKPLGCPTLWTFNQRPMNSHKISSIWSEICQVRRLLAVNRFLPAESPYPSTSCRWGGPSQNISYGQVCTNVVLSTMCRTALRHRCSSKKVLMFIFIVTPTSHSLRHAGGFHRPPRDRQDRQVHSYHLHCSLATDL